MTSVLLIRHAHTTLLGRVLYGRMTGTHLSAEGRESILLLGTRLRQRLALREVVSSPLERALDTARSIATPHGLPVTVDPRITEVDFGSWAGMSFDELSGLPEWAHYNRHRSCAAPPDGELMVDVQARAWKSMQEIAARHRDVPGSTVAVVTHGDVIRALLLLILGAPLDHIQKFEIAPSSISEILVSDGNATVRRVNEVFA